MSTDDPTDIWRPLARRDDLAVEPHEGGLRLFDRRSEMAHQLSATSARLWQSADGNHTLGDLAEEFEGDGVDPALARELTEVGLQDLCALGLVYDPPVRRAVISRRDVLMKLGAASTVAASFGLVSCMPTTTSTSTSTTSPPTTAGGTTSEPTTGAPTTEAPATEAPTTGAG